MVAAITGVVAAMLLAIPVIAGAADNNSDSIPDKWEKRHDLSLNVKQTRRDQDRDGRGNLSEFRHGTDPRDADTDNDGVADGNECIGTVSGDDDSDDDGVTDENEVECEDHHGGDSANSGPGGGAESGHSGTDDGPNHT
jgi:hypothetical protein